MDLTSILTRLARLLAATLVGALLSHLTPSVYNLVNNLIIHIGGQDALVSAVGIGFLTVGGSIWAWLKTKYHIQIALALPKGASIEQVQEASKAFELTPPRNPIDRTN